MKPWDTYSLFPLFTRHERVDTCLYRLVMHQEKSMDPSRVLELNAFVPARDFALSKQSVTCITTPCVGISRFPHTPAVNG